MLTQSGALGFLLVGPVSHTSKIYMDYVQIFNAFTVFSSFYCTCFIGH